MPRVHPRCGTNLAAGATLFLGIFLSPWVESWELRFFVAAFATLYLWKRLGSLMQLFITTKPASDKQIRSGIRAGQELLDRYATSRISMPSVPVRIWRSGMLHVMLGSILCSGLVWVLFEALEVYCNVKLPH
jgi:hypothetical protein